MTTDQEKIEQLKAAYRKFETNITSLRKRQMELEKELSKFIDEKELAKLREQINRRAAQ